MRAIASVRSCAVGDQLGDQRIVVRRNYVVGIGGCVHADADVARQIQAGDASGRGRERVRILGIDAALDGVAANVDRLRDHLRERMPGRDQNLALHQIDAGDRFRNRMLHLNARVHLDEIEIAFFVHQEFDGAGIGVADVAHGVMQAQRSFSRATPESRAGEGASSSNF